MTGRTAVAVVLLVLLAAVLLLAMARSWRNAQAGSTAQLPALPTVPTTPDAEPALGAARTGVLDGVYVTTTEAGQPLSRVSGHGLGVRAPAEVQVHDAGLVVLRRGATDLFVPARDVVGVERTAGMAGKVVGGDRLVVVRWRLGDGPVLDTGLHLRHPTDRDVLTEALRALAAHHEETA